MVYGLYMHVWFVRLGQYLVKIQLFENLKSATKIYKNIEEWLLKLSK